VEVGFVKWQDSAIKMKILLFLFHFSIYIYNFVKKLNLIKC